MVKLFKLIEKLVSPLKVILRHFPFLIDFYLKLRDQSILNFSRPQVTSYGFKFVAYSPVSDYNHADTDLIVSEFKNSDIFVDIGANVGFYTALALNAGKHVIAVEPMAQNLRFIFQNLAINKWNNIEVFPIGLSATTGIAKIYGACTGASLVKNWSGVSEQWKHSIPINTLDNILVNRFNNRRILIKIDVEGAEFDLMSGAKETLARAIRPVWIVEICFKEHFSAGFNANFTKTFKLFWDSGYQSFTIWNKALTIVRPQDVARWVDKGERDFGEVTFLFR